VRHASYYLLVVTSRQAPDRSRQKARTYQAIVQAAAAIVREGRQPTIAEAAQAAGVHRSTAYRYFPTPESLLADATLTAFAPSEDSVFAGVAPDDPAALIEAAVRAVAAYSFREEAMFRSIVRVTIDRWFAAQTATDTDAVGPIRETRRFLWIDHALRPLADRLAPAALARLRNALTLVFGAEAVIVTRDVCNLDPQEATEVMAWAATSLIAAALEQS
jgi:AcrR family transcriptional regulator